MILTLTPLLVSMLSLPTFDDSTYYFSLCPPDSFCISLESQILLLGDPLGNLFPLQAEQVVFYISLWGFPGGSNSKESACNVGDLSLIPELGRFPGEGNGSPLLYFCPEDSMDWGAWQVTGWGVTMGSQAVRHNWATNMDNTMYIFLF